MKEKGSPGAGCAWLRTEASDYSLMILGMTVRKEGQDRGRGLKAVCGQQPLRNKTLFLSRAASYLIAVSNNSKHMQTRNIKLCGHSICSSLGEVRRTPSLLMEESTRPQHGLRCLLS